MHCVKIAQIRSFFWSVFHIFLYSDPNSGKYGPEKTPYLDIFHAVMHLFADLFFPVIETAIGIYLRS